MKYKVETNFSPLWYTISRPVTLYSLFHTRLKPIRKFYSLDRKVKGILSRPTDLTSILVSSALSEEPGILPSTDNSYHLVDLS